MEIFVDFEAIFHYQRNKTIDYNLFQGYIFHFVCLALLDHRTNITINMIKTIKRRLCCLSDF